VFLANVDSNIRIGSGIGIDIDVEEALDLESTNTVLRADALWRFTENRRHRLDLIWFAFRRDGNRRILDDIPIEDDDGNVIIIPTGATVDTMCAFLHVGVLIALQLILISKRRICCRCNRCRQKYD
jgi:hypothetical protein